MKLRLTTAVFAVVCSVLCSHPAQGQDDVREWLSEEILVPVEDRTALTDDDGPRLADALEQLSAIPHEELSAGAESQASHRLTALQAIDSARRSEFSVFEDLMRFPHANRGKPVHLAGLLRSSEALTLGESGFRIAQLVPNGNTASVVAVLLPAAGELPEIGGAVEVTGIFWKLIELPAAGDMSPGVGPLIVAHVLSESQRGSTAAPDTLEWQSVRHQTIGVRQVEKALYYRLLEQAATASPADLEAKARFWLAERRPQAPRTLAKREPFPVFVDLFRHPELYEGRAVTLKGHARAIRSYPAGPNAEGLETLYEAWVYTDDSQSNPAVVVATSASPDLPIGDDVQVSIQATGYFFKIYGYRAQDTTRIAPMILAGKIEVLPESAPSGPPAWLLAALGVVFGVLLVWVLVSYLKIRGGRIAKRREVKPDFSAIDTTPEERLP